MTEEQKVKYELFKKKMDKDLNTKREAWKIKADEAYNDGLWNSVKYSPYKWFIFALFCR